MYRTSGLALLVVGLFCTIILAGIADWAAADTPAGLSQRAVVPLVSRDLVPGPGERILRVGLVTFNGEHPGGDFTIEYSMPPASEPGRDTLPFAPDAPVSAPAALLATQSETKVSIVPPEGWAVGGYSTSLLGHGITGCSKEMTYGTPHIVQPGPDEYLVCVRVDRTVGDVVRLQIEKVVLGDHPYGVFLGEISGGRGRFALEVLSDEEFPSGVVIHAERGPGPAISVTETEVISAAGIPPEWILLGYNIMADGLGGICSNTGFGTNNVIPAEGDAFVVCIGSRFGPETPATGVTFTIEGVEQLSESEFAVHATYLLNGTNDGAWSARVHYLQQCRDATQLKLGTESGIGGLITENGGVLTGATGTMEFRFSASIVSDEPAIEWPVSCEGVQFAAWHGDGPNQLSPPLVAPTTWQEGTLVIECTPDCLGGW